MFASAGPLLRDVKPWCSVHCGMTAVTTGRVAIELKTGFTEMLFTQQQCGVILLFNIIYMR